LPDRRRLSDEDISAIVAALDQRQGHVCRFTVTPEEVEETVKFRKHINDLMSETGSTIRKTILVAGVGGLISLLVLGLYAKLKSALGL
jgi:butyrate kinase